MAKLVIHSYPKNPRVYKALIAGKYNGVEISYPQDFAFGTANKTPEFLAKNPLGQVPVLDTPEGSIWESNAIARYVARQGKAAVYGHNAFEASQIDQWIDFTANNIDLAAAAWLYPIQGYVPNDHIAHLATQKAKETLKKVLRVLNNHLQHHTFLVGERVSLADIIMTMSLYGLYTMVFDAEFRKDFASVNRWFQTCVHQPNFAAVVGEVKLCEKAAVAAAPAPEAAKPKGEKKPKEEKPKGEAKPKAEAKPKEEKKKEEKPKAAEKPKEEAHADAGEEDEEKDAKPKEKNPLDLLPPAKMQLDEWKRMYSNNDTKTVAMPWFWQNYDAEGYSLWKVEYKYNDELAKIFMTSNMINGWFQRLEKLHKYAFGSVLIHGKEEPKSLSVSGVWLFRGKEIPKDMQECDDAALYNWSKLDEKDAATKTLIDEYFAWEGDFGGKGKPEQGKTFK